MVSSCFLSISQNVWRGRGLLAVSIRKVSDCLFLFPIMFFALLSSSIYCCSNHPFVLYIIRMHAYLGDRPAMWRRLLFMTGISVIHNHVHLALAGLVLKSSPCDPMFTRPHHFCRHPLNDLPVHQSLISWFKAIELIWILYSDRPPNKWYFIYVHINLQTARSSVPFLYINQHFPKNRGWQCCPSLLQYHCLILPRNISDPTTRCGEKSRSFEQTNERDWPSWLWAFKYIWKDEPKLSDQVSSFHVMMLNKI